MANPPASRLAAPDGWTLDRQRRFIEELGRTGSVERASAAVGVHPSSAYRFRARPAGRGLFAAAWTAARRRAVRSLEESALARAIHGDVRPLYSRGEVVGTQIVHSDRLVVFLLQSLRQSLAHDEFEARMAQRDPDATHGLGNLLNIMGGPHRSDGTPVDAPPPSPRAPATVQQDSFADTAARL